MTIRVHSPLEEQTIEVGNRVRPLHGGNGNTLGGLLQKIPKVKKKASKVFGKNGETSCNPQKMVFKDSFFFVTDRSFAADSGLL